MTRNAMMPLFAAALTLTLTTATPARATIISGAVTGGTALTAGGTFVKLTRPLNNPIGPANTVGQDNFQSPDLFGFDEDQNILIGSALAVDVGTAPAAGTVVASHYIFFDPLAAETMIGTVNFDSDVIAIFTSTGTLLASDFLDTSVNFRNPNLRGLEPAQGDSVTITGPRQITFNSFASSPGDYIRVLTQFSPGAVPTGTPEPGTVSLLGLGLAAIAGSVRRRRRTAR